MSTPAGRVASIMKGKTLAESMLVLAKKELDQMRDMLANVKMLKELRQEQEKAAAQMRQDESDVASAPPRATVSSTERAASALQQHRDLVQLRQQEKLEHEKLRELLESFKQGKEPIRGTVN